MIDDQLRDPRVTAVLRQSAAAMDMSFVAVKRLVADTLHTYREADRAFALAANATKGRTTMPQMKEPETVPCKFCDTPTPFTGTKMCNNCWEVEWRLRHFIHHWKARRFLFNLLANAEGPPK